MIKKLSATLSLLLLISCSSQASAAFIYDTTPQDNSIVNEKFDNQGHLNKTLRTSIDGNGDMAIVSQPVQTSHHSVRFSVPNDGISYRAELSGYGVESGTYQYQFSLFIPKDWQTTHLETILAQWHGYKLSNGQHTNPPISLSIQNDHWRLAVHTLTSPTTVEEKAFDLPKIMPGTWNQFDVKIKWSTPTTPGLITLYHDNQLWLNYAGINNYHQATAPYFKIGIYRPLWNPEKHLPYVTGGMPVTVYTDKIKIVKSL